MEDEKSLRVRNYLGQGRPPPQGTLLSTVPEIGLGQFPSQMPVLYNLVAHSTLPGQIGEP